LGAYKCFYWAILRYYYFIFCR